MFNELYNFFISVNSNLSLPYVAIRTILIYTFFVVIFRFSNHRFRLQTPFDFIMPIILGSLLSRSINGSASFISGFIACTLLMFLHWLFGYLAFHSQKCGKLLKGTPKPLIEDGKINWNEMRKNHITENDLLTEYHQQTHKEELAGIKTAYLERNGTITFIYDK